MSAALLLGTAAQAQTPLELYDAAIGADAGTLPPVATLGTAVTLTGAAGAAFDFGPTADDVTIEFIVEGNPGANGSSFLAVGTTPASSLRYEVWDNTGEVGFTQAGVADYQFAPGVPSPAEATHLTYVWTPANTTMKVYVNGTLAGTATGVSAAFVMPSGAGWIGANASGEEGMVGTIHRVTVYDTAIPETAIRRHASAFGAHVSKALAAYDTAIGSDGLTVLAKSTIPAVLNGSGYADCDFGYSQDDVTMEFIVEGDPTFNNTAFLAVAENSASSLRFELWDNTGQLGFTLAAVADYAFSPGVASPTLPTHLTYAWNASTLTMKLYLNGQLAGTTANVSANFAMPYGFGRLGNNMTGTEPMSGTIYRVTVYDDLLEDSAILRHAKAFTDVLRPPIITSFQAAPASIDAGGSTVLSWEVQNAAVVLVNGVDRTGTTSLTVTPRVSAAYTLTAQNAFGQTTAQVRVQVKPELTAYDAAITADETGGLVPSTKMTSPVFLSGTGGAAFDFGANAGDVTMELIVEGDPSIGAGSYLAVGENAVSNLRFESWNNTGQVGFTQLGVADYLFDVPVPSSTWPTHLTYVWDSTALVMKVYVNGSLAGTRADVDPGFSMPSGPGWLGSNPSGGEALIGSVFRVTIYPSQVTETAIKRHADAFLGAAAPLLHAYDNAITTSAGAGLPPGARLFAPVTLTGVGGVSFQFGAVTGDATLEFILEGDPSAFVSSFLAVGVNAASSLRYEVWYDTAQLGFTQAGVADYQFTPGVPSPAQTTHVTYAWSAADTTMKLYLNGALAGTTTGVSGDFGLPADLGVLGNNAGGTEPMRGLIHRVTVYDELLAEEVILAHGRAFAPVVEPPVVAVDLSGNLPAITLTQGVTGGHYRVEYRVSLAEADAWQLLADIPSLSGTTARVDDPTPWAGQTQRYYRAVRVP